MKIELTARDIKMLMRACSACYQASENGEFLEIHTKLENELEIYRNKMQLFESHIS